MMKFAATWLLLASLLGATHVQAAEATTKPQATAEKGNVHMVSLKNVPPRLMAFWLDPTRNVGPESGESAEDYFKRDLSKAIPKPRGGEPTQEGAFRLPEGVQMVQAVEPLKSLRVIGSEEGVRELKETIAFLDRPLRHVEIEAQAIRIDSEDAKSLGLDLSAPAGSSTIRFLSVGIFFQSQKLKALGKARHVLTSRVVATNNLTSHLFPAPPAKTSIATEAKENAFPFRFDVVPTINNDDSITLLLSVNKTSKSQIEKPTDNIQTIINIKNGDSLAIFGFDPDLLPAAKDAKPNHLILLVTSRIVLDKK